MDHIYLYNIYFESVFIIMKPCGKRERKELIQGSITFI